MSSHRSLTGFTLLEFTVVIAILAILAAVALVGYQQYTMRARGTEIVAQYDALRTGVHARVLSQGSEDCAALAASYGTSNLASPYANLNYGFETVSGGGYRPVLTVCARTDKDGPLNLKVARGVYDTLSRDGVVEANPVLTDSVVSFALRLTDDAKAFCQTYAVKTTSACGQPQIPGPTSCPAGQDRLQGQDQSGGAVSWACFDACPSGQTRKPGRLACEPA